jgi:hypothetical protein
MSHGAIRWQSSKQKPGLQIRQNKISKFGAEILEYQDALPFFVTTVMAKVFSGEGGGKKNDTDDFNNSDCGLGYSYIPVISNGCSQ